MCFSRLDRRNEKKSITFKSERNKVNTLWAHRRRHNRLVQNPLTKDVSRPSKRQKIHHYKNIRTKWYPHIKVWLPLLSKYCYSVHWGHFPCISVTTNFQPTPVTHKTNKVVVRGVGWEKRRRSCAGNHSSRMFVKFEWLQFGCLLPLADNNSLVPRHQKTAMDGIARCGQLTRTKTLLKVQAMERKKKHRL